MLEARRSLKSGWCLRKRGKEGESLSEVISERANAERLSCIVPRINDRHVVLLGVNGGPVGSFTDYESVDFHLTCLCESFSRCSGSTADCPSLCSPSLSEGRSPQLTVVILREVSSSLS